MPDERVENKLLNRIKMETILKAAMSISGTVCSGVFIRSIPKMLLLDCENE